MRNTLKKIVYKIIKDNYKITKKEIKDKTYDYLYQNNMLSKELIIAFGDIGWIFQTLRQEDKLIEVEKLGNEWFWSST
tara:strand:- start:4245 stop:4478 length:234 start_codon:yes stop_codon:yes gene_type:complete